MPVAVSTDPIAADLAARGRHPDPFAYFGMHEMRAGGVVVVRTFLPPAMGVEVIDSATGEAVARLERIHDDGLFEGVVPGRATRFRYRLRWTDGFGARHEIEDPYRFGTILGDVDAYLIAEGTHLRLYEKLGAHPMTIDGVVGTAFAVWAPNAQRVSVVGTFNGWDGRRHPMRRRNSGVWEIFLPDVHGGQPYKFELIGAHGELLPLKADPFARESELRPATASIVADAGLTAHAWSDGAWLARRTDAQRRDAPITIYEVHLGSWRRVPEEGNRFLTYRELADQLVPYVREMGFTHIELLPVMEHPFDGSWGYQSIGLFAPTSRFGTPADFKAFIDRAHAEGIGVILDWVPGHFPTDAHGLAYFDGTHLYEHADPRQGFQPDWNTLIYNFGRTEVANYLLSNALYWLNEFHADGLRVDAVASMLYLDYSRNPGEWIPNEFGGNENLAAIAFLRRLNELCYGEQPGVTTVAEESTAWPRVSAPTYLGGLGFGYKWNMGWMHDTLHYMMEDPIHRRYHHNRLTFGLLYAFSENFVLPLSHDEVVHGKRSLLAKMPGDRWQRFANLRLLYGWMYAHPGKKLLFMGSEIGQEREWSHDTSLDWHLLDDPQHRAVQSLVRDLNALYRSSPALHELDMEPAGFEWIDAQDVDSSVAAFVRRGRSSLDRPLVVVANFTPVVRHGYRVGVPTGGRYRERLNTDATAYGGSGVANAAGWEAEPQPWHGRSFSLSLTLPPLAVLILEPENG